MEDIETKKTLTNYIEEQAYTFVKDIDEAKKIAISVVNTVKMNKDLVACDKNSIMQCVNNALGLGLAIDVNQYCWLVPYQGKATLQIGFKGYIHKLTGLGAIVDTPKLIYKGEELLIESDDKIGDSYTLKNRVPFPREEDLSGIMIYIKHNGRGYVETMSKAEIDKIKGCAKQGYVWGKWYGEMAKKSIIKRACKVHFAKEIADLEKFDNQQYDVSPPKTQGLEELNNNNKE